MSVTLATVVAVSVPFFASVTCIALYALRGATPAERAAILRALAQLTSAMLARSPRHSRRTSAQSNSQDA